MPVEEILESAVESYAGPAAGPKNNWNRRIRTIAKYLGYAYLLRVPILIGIVLVALPPLALWGPLKSLLENAFVLSPGNIFWVMIVALTLAWSLLVVGRVIALNGERFGLDQWLTEDVITGKHVFWTAVPTLSVLVCASIEKIRALENKNWWDALAKQDWWVWLGAAIGGALIAYVLGLLGVIISVTLAPRYNFPHTRKSPQTPYVSASASERFDIPFPFPFLSKKMRKKIKNTREKIFEKAENFRLNLSADPNWAAKWAKKNIPEDLQIGYLDPDGHLWPAQWLVTILAIISVIVYVSLGAFKEARLGAPSSVPALSYVLIAMLVATWILSTITYFLDRYRVPLLVPLFLFCVISGQFPQSDHYFEMRDGVSVIGVDPADALTSHLPSDVKPWLRSKNGEVVVVATAGGGIQAAGWTAKVLTGLQEECSSVSGGSVNFANSIAAISAVSGGAVGTLFFANSYNTSATSPGFQPPAGGMEEIVRQAEGEALSDTVWAMVYVDPFRTLFPYFRFSEQQKKMDRGYVLEQIWANRGGIHAYLSNWREGVAEGKRPVVIFNATVAETGQPFLLATTDFDTNAGTGAETDAKRRTLNEAYKNADLPVVTATRLAASFPYVSPASRPLSSKPEQHLVDGGYFDNFGVDSLTAWLDQALTSLKEQAHPSHILFIEIRSFPYGISNDVGTKGWFYQAYAPIEGLMSVRTTAQLVRDREKLKLLTEKWHANDVVIEEAQFTFPGQDAPLSWQLTKKEKDAIDVNWDETLNKAASPNRQAIATVRKFCSAVESSAPATR